MPPNTAPHNDRCASLLGQGCDCRSPWGDEDDRGAMPDIVDIAATNPAVGRTVDGAAAMNMIVGDLQTGEVYEEPLPPPVTPEEFVNGT